MEFLETNFMDMLDYLCNFWHIKYDRNVKVMFGMRWFDFDFVKSRKIRRVVAAMSLLRRARSQIA